MAVIEIEAAVVLEIRVEGHAEQAEFVPVAAVEIAADAVGNIDQGADAVEGARRIDCNVAAAVDDVPARRVARCLQHFDRPRDVLVGHDLDAESRIRRWTLWCNAGVVCRAGRKARSRCGAVECGDHGQQEQAGDNVPRDVAARMARAGMSQPVGHARLLPQESRIVGPPGILPATTGQPKARRFAVSSAKVSARYGAQGSSVRRSKGRLRGMRSGPTRAVAVFAPTPKQELADASIVKVNPSCRAEPTLSA